MRSSNHVTIDRATVIGCHSSICGTWDSPPGQLPTSVHPSIPGLLHDTASRSRPSWLKGAVRQAASHYIPKPGEIRQLCTLLPRVLLTKPWLFLVSIMVFLSVSVFSDAQCIFPWFILYLTQFLNFLELFSFSSDEGTVVKPLAELCSWGGIVNDWDLSRDGRMLVMHTDYNFYIIVRDLCLQTFVEDLQHWRVSQNSMLEWIDCY